MTKDEVEQLETRVNQSTSIVADIMDRVPKWAQSQILIGYRGSQAHGTTLPPEHPKGTDDIDVFGVSVQPIQFYCGLRAPKDREVFTTAGEDLDIEIFDIRKLVGLLEKGNPNVHQWLWMDDYLLISPLGQLLRSRREGFLGTHMLKAFGGYAKSQVDRMNDGRKRGYMGEKRNKLLLEHGYDIKNAAHCIRLLVGGIHLALTNKILVKLEGKMLAQILAVKRGEWELEAVVEVVRLLMEEFDESVAQTTLPSGEGMRAWSNETLDLIFTSPTYIHESKMKRRLL
ncbi:MAG: nucleotidyltransferase domain-containing protein [Bacteroidales bacterium]|nr:nucleotidyltransferase domain-containing protein [Candidatus Latescibacterota bacterium]